MIIPSLNLKPTIRTLIITPETRNSHTTEITSGRTCILEIDRSSRCCEGSKKNFNESTDSFRERGKEELPIIIEDTLLKNKN